MTRKIDITKLVSPVYEQLFFEYFNTRTKILYGGRISAKSWVSAFFVIYVTIQPTYSKWICVREVYAGIKKSMFDTLEEAISLMGLTDEFKFNIAQGNLAITHIPTGNKIFFLGLDKPANAKSIANPTAAWFEEADEISFNGYIKTKQSLRGPKGTVFHELISFNPERENSWINNHFFPPKESYEKPDGMFDIVKSTKPDTVILHTCYKHNYWCTPEQMKDLEANRFIQDDNFYKVYTLGLWGGALKGLIYKTWDTYSGADPDGEIIYGIDYGFNDPTVLLKIVKIEKDLYIRKMFYESGYTNQEFLNEIEKDDLIHSKHAFVYPDAAEPDRIAELEQRGYNVQDVKKGKGSIVSGIDYIKRYNLHVHEDSIEVINELGSYTWKEDRQGGLREEPIDQHNHAMDALRYAVDNHGRDYWEQHGTGLPKSSGSLRKSRIDKYSSW